MLVEGRFVSQSALAEEWHQVTGDSFIVDVRSVPDRDSAIRYLTKYATKPAPATVTDDAAALDEFVLTIANRRLWQPFGSWKALITDDDQDPPQQERIGSLANLRWKAQDGDADARRWLEAAHRKWPQLAALFPLPPPG